MKKNIILWFVIFAILLSFLEASHAMPASPVLTCSVNDFNLDLSWSAIEGADGYTLSYATYPVAHTITHIDLGERLNFSADLWVGAAYYIGVRAHEYSEFSEYSNIEFFKILSPVEKTLAERHDEDLTGILQNIVEASTVPGACLLVSFTDGSVWSKAAGNASVDDVDTRSMDPDMRFRIGSVTKTMIATSVLLLVDQGKLKLHDTVDKFFPGLISHGSITVEELLSHSSRLVNYTKNDIFGDIYLDQPEFPWTKKEVVDIFKNDPLIEAQEPNDSFYSNSNYYLLGMLIEKISGMDLNEFLKTWIFTPLKMTDTCLPTENEIKGHHTDGYVDLNLNSRFEADEKITNQDPLAIWSAGAVISTVKDLSIWQKELMSGSLISKELQEKRMEFNWHVNGASPEVNYGLGVMNQFGQIGHTGAVAGYTTVMFRYMGTDIIAYTNGYYLKEQDPNIPDQLLQAVSNLINPGRSANSK